MEGTTWIYGLREEGSDHYRYVGSTVDPDRRLAGHLSGSCVAEGLKAWLDSVRAFGQGIAMDRLEELPVRSDGSVARHPMVARAEDRWITDLLCDGHDLVNARVPGSKFRAPNVNRKRPYRVLPSAVIAAREAAFLAQIELAAKVGITPHSVNRIERGRIPHPHRKTLRSIAEVLGVPVTDLVERS